MTSADLKRMPVSGLHVWQNRRLVSRGVERTVLGIVGIGLIGTIWWIVSLFTNPLQVPSPTSVLQQVFQNWSNIPALQYVAFQSGGISAGLKYTAINVIIGVAVGSCVGIVTGIVIGLSRGVRILVQPALVVGATVPVFIVLPFLVEWFGTTRIVCMGVVIVFAFVTTAVAAQHGTYNVGRYYRDYAASLGTTWPRELRSIILPAITPEVIGSLRVTVAGAWGFEAVAELVTGQPGAGQIIGIMGRLSNMAGMLAVVLSIVALAVIFDLIVATVGRIVTRWHE